ncbi:MAG: hypothetical protein MUP44_09945, partial [Anaerolineales bacterium]|nr:hypothetical protein [Anaerolineales bacterium]
MVHLLFHHDEWERIHKPVRDCDHDSKRRREADLDHSQDLKRIFLQSGRSIVAFILPPSLSASRPTTATAPMTAPMTATAIPPTTKFDTKFLLVLAPTPTTAFAQNQPKELL